jgi:hypothetical protein
MRHFLADAGGFRTTMEVLGMTAGMNTRPAIGLLRHGPRPRDHEEIPIGSLVRTPTGKEAEVKAYRGYGTNNGRGYRPGPGQRPSRVYLVCRYVNPENKKFAIVQLLPELVVVVRVGPERSAA